MTDLIQIEKSISSILEEIDKAYFDIPFGNSQFQIENFIVNAQYTQERAYRAVGLQMSTKIRALKEAYFNLKKGDIDIEEMEEKLNSDINKYEKKRLELDLLQKQENKQYTLKLINDAYAELNILYGVFNKLPKFTREEFENGERKHFEVELIRQAKGIAGALESLDNMGCSLEQFEIDKKEQKEIL